MARRKPNLLRIQGADVSQAAFERSSCLSVSLSPQVPESNQTILTGGYVDLHNVVNNTRSTGSAQVGESMSVCQGCSRLSEHLDKKNLS